MTTPIVHTPPGAKPAPEPLYLESTYFLDCDDPGIRRFAEEAARGATSPREQAVKLFYRIRDGWRYDPFIMHMRREEYVASWILGRSNAWCVQKGALLATAARALGIPAAIGMSDVTNHLTTDKLRERMGGTDLFVDHGYAVLYLDGNWVKAAPVFNIELCRRFGVVPTEFDGTTDAVFQEYDAANRRHMEYLRDHGMWSDFPYDRLEADMRAHYPAECFEDTTAERFEDGKRLY